MTYLHAHLKSNPEGSIDLWVSEKEKPKREFYENASSHIFYSKDFNDALEKWQSSLVCFPTLPEQREEILKLVVKTGRNIIGALQYGVDVDPALFEIKPNQCKDESDCFYEHIAGGCKNTGKCIRCAAVLKSTPAQEEDLWPTNEEIKDMIYKKFGYPGEVFFISGVFWLRDELRKNYKLVKR